MTLNVRSLLLPLTLVAAVALTGFSASSARADVCSGNVINVEQFRDNNLIAKIQGTGVLIQQGIICSLTGAHGGVSPETCKVWASLLQAALLSGRRVDLWVTDGTPCTNADNMSHWFSVIQSIKLR